MREQGHKTTEWDNISNTLIVDDSPTMRELISLTLQRNDLTTTVCESGKEALNFCMLGTYDVVFLDIEMPEMNGFDTARNIRKMSNTGNTYIVAVTAKAVTKQFIDQCIASGINDCLVKPLQEDVLRKRLALWGKLKRQNMLI